MDMDDIVTTFGIIYLVIFLIVLIALILTVPTYYLWNWLCPKLFGLPKISLLESLGINLLFGILFRSSTSKSK